MPNTNGILDELPQSSTERFLRALILGDTTDLPLPQSRIDYYLLAAITKNKDNLPLSQSRIDEYLKELVNVIVDSEGKVITIDDPDEMDALLIEENEGKVYMYIGETTDTYINGDIYIVTENNFGQLFLTSDGKEFVTSDGKHLIVKPEVN